jgi:hypothetical protein
MEINAVLEILKNYGLPGVVLIVFVYILLKGRISFEYPRPEKKR